MPDNKQRLLVALYVEYQRDDTNMARVAPDKVNLSVEDFVDAAVKLLNEGLIRGDELFSDCGASGFLFPKIVAITKDGIDIIERQFCIRPFDCGTDKINAIRMSSLV